MPVEPDLSAKSMFKNPVLYSSMVLAVAAIAAGWILFSRWRQTREIENRVKAQKTQQQQERDRITLEQMGGKELAIQNFYASAETIHRGQAVQLCYGVANAKSVKLEPQSNPVWPSHSRCLYVTPLETTVYTLSRRRAPAFRHGDIRRVMQRIDID